MGLAELFATFDKIEATSGKKEKFALLESFRGSPDEDLAKKYFSYAMDWFLIYGVGEKTLEFAAVEDLDSTVFGAEPEKVTPVPVTESWDGAFRIMHGLLGDPGYEKPNKAAIVAFVQSITDPQAKKWIIAMLLKKARMGVSEKTVNKVWPNLVRFFEVQLADKLEDVSTLFKSTYPKPEKPNKRQLAKIDALPDYYYLEPKLDGIRAVCRVRPKQKEVIFLSRGGQILNNTAPAGINEFLLKACTDDVVFDGELFGANWNETQKVTSKGEGEAPPELVAKLRFFIFDMLTGAEWDAQQASRTYNERREGIGFDCMTISDAKVVKTVSHACESPEQIDNHFRKYLEKKFEGVMVKDPRGLYEFKRTEAWWKYKPLETDEFEVVGKYEGKAFSKNAGTLGGLTVKVGELQCEVGSGFSDEERAEFWANPPIGKMIEIEFKERTPDGLLREPVFVRVRDDKRPSEG